MKLFNYENFNLTINEPEVLLIKEFKDLLNKDKSKDKSLFFKQLTYLYLYCDFQSPFVNFTDEQKHTESLKASELKEKDVIELKPAMKVYVDILLSNPILQMIEDMKQGMAQLSVYFKTVNFTEKVESGARKGTLLHDPKELVALMKQATFIIDQVKLLRERAIEEIKGEDSKVRGDYEEGWDE